MFKLTPAKLSSHGRYLAWLTMMCQRSSLRSEIYLTKQTQQVQIWRIRSDKCWVGACTLYHISCICAAIPVGICTQPIDARHLTPVKWHSSPISRSGDIVTSSQFVQLSLLPQRYHFPTNICQYLSTLGA